jgi:hypothetical protein
LSSTGLFWTAGTAGFVVLLALIVMVRDRLDAVLEAKDGAVDSVRLLNSRETLVATAVLASGLVALGAWQSHAKRLVARSLFEPAVTIELPAIWTGDAPPAGGPAIFVAPSHGMMPPVLSIGTRSCPAGDTRAVLQQLTEEGAAQLAGFVPGVAVDWGRQHPGAVMFEFEYERGVGGITVPVMGAAVVSRLGADRALVFTVFYDYSDRDRRWDIARALRSVPE